MSCALGAARRGRGPRALSDPPADMAALCYIYIYIYICVYIYIYKLYHTYIYIYIYTYKYMYIYIYIYIYIYYRYVLSQTIYIYIYIYIYLYKWTWRPARGHGGPVHPIRIARIHVTRFSPRVGLPRQIYLIGNLTAALRLSKGWSEKTRILDCELGVCAQIRMHILYVHTHDILYYTLQQNNIYIIQYNTIQYNTIQYNTIQYNTIQYNTIQYNTLLYYTILYYTVLYYYTILYHILLCYSLV